MLKYSQHHWKKTPVFISNIKENDNVGDNSLDGDLLRGMDSSTHHDMFASLIAANKLTVSTTRDVAVFLFFIFVFAHCAWRCLMFLLGPPLAPRITWNIVPSKRSAAVRPPCRTCYSGYPASPLESVEKVPLLRGSYIIFKLPLLMSFLTPHSLFAFTETYAGMVVLSETIRRGQFAKPR